MAVMTQHEFIQKMFEVLPTNSRVMLKHYTRSSFHKEKCIETLEQRNNELREEMKANQKAISMMKRIK